MGHQRALYDALREKDESLAMMYYGALLVLNQEENPERYVLAAHNLRELSEKLPRKINAPIGKKIAPLNDKVIPLIQAWENAISKCDYDKVKNTFNKIDNNVAKFFGKMSEFFEWFHLERGSRRQQVKKTLTSLDPLKLSLPEPIQDLRTDKWQKYYDIFTKVSHHNTNNDFKDFDSRVRSFEQYLLDLLNPRTFEDLTEIDKIIQEGEENAQA